jgi:class 3 adenylate cyclase
MSAVQSVVSRREAPDSIQLELGPSSARRLGAVLFTDIVDSAALAWRLGDRAWCGLLETHHEIVRAELERHRGREVDTSGDGFFAVFDGASAAIACAAAVRDTLRSIGLEVRSGVHAGEFEELQAGIGGIGVAIGSRIATLAGAGEVLVSSVVKDLVLGSDLRFRHRGDHELKGLPGRWRLFALV